MGCQSGTAKAPNSPSTFASQCHQTCATPRCSRTTQTEPTTQSRSTRRGLPAPRHAQSHCNKISAMTWRTQRLLSYPSEAVAEHMTLTPAHSADSSQTQLAPSRLPRQVAELSENVSGLQRFPRKNVKNYCAEHLCQQIDCGSRIEGSGDAEADLGETTKTNCQKLATIRSIIFFADTDGGRVQLFKSKRCGTCETPRGNALRSRKPLP